MGGLNAALPVSSAPRAREEERLSSRRRRRRVLAAEEEDEEEEEEGSELGHSQMETTTTVPNRIFIAAHRDPLIGDKLLEITAIIIKSLCSGRVICRWTDERPP